MPKAITSLEGFIRKLAKLDDVHKGAQLLFRGHSDISYKISPSVFRNKNHASSEHLMLKQLLSQQPSEFFSDQGLFDYLVRAQHYGLPTRLLDVSLNPLVALYFAVCSKPNARAQVIIFIPEIQKQKYFDSDVVSCMSALSLLTLGEKNNIKDEIKVKLKETDGKTWIIIGEKLDDFNKKSEIAKRIQIIRTTKPDFRPIIQPIDLVRPVSVIPRKLHPRISAQNGAFILFGFAETPTKGNMDHIKTDVIDIDAASKNKIKKELSYIGISENVLFPEIEKAALAIKSRYA